MNNFINKPREPPSDPLAFLLSCKDTPDKLAPRSADLTDTEWVQRHWNNLGLKLLDDGFNATLDWLPSPVSHHTQFLKRHVPIIQIGSREGIAIYCLSDYGQLVGMKDGEELEYSGLGLKIVLEGRGIELLPPFSSLGHVTVENSYLTNEALALAQYYLLWMIVEAYYSGDTRSMLVTKVPDYDMLSSALLSYLRNVLAQETTRPNVKAVIHFRNMGRISRGENGRKGNGRKDNGREDNGRKDDDAPIVRGSSSNDRDIAPLDPSAVMLDTSSADAQSDLPAAPVRDNEKSPRITPRPTISLGTNRVEVDGLQHGLSTPLIAHEGRVDNTSDMTSTVMEHGEHPCPRPVEQSRDLGCARAVADDGNLSPTTARNSMKEPSPSAVAVDRLPSPGGSEPQTPLPVTNPELCALASLRQHVGAKLDRLPTLAQCTFADLTDYVSVDLLVAWDEDATVDHRDICVYMKPVRDAVEVSALDPEEYAIESSGVLDPSVSKDSLIAKANMSAPFGSVPDRAQFNALVTYYVLLAAEAGWYSLKHNDIPASHELITNLQAACDTVAGTSAESNIGTNIKREDSPPIVDNTPILNKKRTYGEVMGFGGGPIEATDLLFPSGRPTKKSRLDQIAASSSAPLMESCDSFAPATDSCDSYAPTSSFRRLPTTPRKTPARALAVPSSVTRSATEHTTTRRLPTPSVESGGTLLRSHSAEPIQPLQAISGRFSVPAAAFTFSVSATSTEQAIYIRKVRDLDDLIARHSAELHINSTLKEAANMKMKEAADEMKMLDDRSAGNMAAISQAVEQKRVAEEAFSNSKEAGGGANEAAGGAMPSMRESGGNTAVAEDDPPT